MTHNDTEELSSKFYPLPCMFTLASLFGGFYSIISSINGNFLVAAYAILVAAVLDGIDGRVARMTGTTSTFGMELDSLCDLVSFGVAPALLAFLWSLQSYGRYGWLAGFLYLATTALRLARFNSQDVDNKSPDFVGLPCPAAAGMIVSSVLFCNYLGITSEVHHISLLLLVYALSYLMVSTHQYPSFKKPSTKRTKRFQILVASVLLFTVVAAEPEVMFFAIFSLYIVYGPVFALYKKIIPSAKVVVKK
jgi:CDP-diacylglycerol--serine O-phosphatidyltransferase